MSAAGEISMMRGPHGDQGQRRPRAEALAAAIDVLTEAAELTSTNGEGRSERADWAEFVAQALAGAAANTGGVERVLSGRPGSWEAGYLRQLLTSTVGQDETYLLEHRTRPVHVELFVDQIMADLGVWKVYDDAEAELARRRDLAWPQPATVLTTQQEAELDEIAEISERVEQQRVQDWTDYGQALTARVEAIAAELPGLSVPSW